MKFALAEAEFQKMKRVAIICPWPSPLHMVPKPDGVWRPFGNYHSLNNVTRPDQYPLPNICDFTNNLKGCKVFLKLLVKGYHQVTMDPGDVYPRMPFVTL